MNESKHHDFLSQLLDEWYYKNKLELNLPNEKFIEGTDYKLTLLLNQGSEEAVISCACGIRINLPKERMNFSLKLLDDVLTYRDKDFFDLVHKKCGEIVKYLMEKLSIDSIRTLLGVEDDIFSIVEENCSALKDIKERACLCLDDGTVIVKPGLRIDLDRFIEALRTKSIHSQISKSTTASSDNDSSLSNTLAKFNMFEENRAYGITSEFNSIDVLRRWLWIFQYCQTSNIRILAFSTDCDPKYLRAMRLITGFFAKLPNIPISERDDALELKLPKGWSSWFYMRTRQLAFCFQDPVHLCTKMRNRLLSQSASMMIGNGEISVSILFDLINHQSKLIHGLVKTDVHPKDKQNFGSCVKISSDDVLSALDDVSGSYAIQVYLRLLRSIILAYIERSTSTIDRIYHSWIAVFICRLCYNSQTCENIFRLTRSMSGTFSSNFPKHHKRRLRKAEHVNDHLQNNNILTQNNIEKTVYRADNDAYKMLAVLGIDKVLKKAHKSTLTELSTFVKIQTEQQSHTTDYSENWNGYSDDESDSEAENTIDQSDMSTESSSEDENDELMTNSSYKGSQFKGIRIFNGIPTSQTKSHFRLKIDKNEKYVHKQTACWLLTDDKTTLSADRLQRVQQTNR
ncbi:unnamed protein product [Rotaria socialis]|uniref:Uncharacterized protein n=3 Tax=Rotaria socialis TaxID=392032 RepID=A0A820T2S5_9BILA|nr:unnamed protein product [Rotaria socialis]CAF4564464.1 unnamed protein product [Rotaria socialis]